jgi:hypothetical protein
MHPFNFQPDPTSAYGRAFGPVHKPTKTLPVVAIGPFPSRRPSRTQGRPITLSMHPG